MAVGAAEPDTVIVEQPAQETQAAVQQAPSNLPIGAQVSSLPGGCQATNVDGTLYYQSGGVWYKPFFGGSGVYYQVVSMPVSQDNTVTQ